MAMKEEFKRKSANIKLFSILYYTKLITQAIKKKKVAFVNASSATFLPRRRKSFQA